MKLNIEETNHQVGTLGAEELCRKQDNRWEGVRIFRWSELAGSKGAGLRRNKNVEGRDERGAGEEPREHSGPKIRDRAKCSLPEAVSPVYRTALPTHDSGLHLI